MCGLELNSVTPVDDMTPKEKKTKATPKKKIIMICVICFVLLAGIVGIVYGVRNSAKSKLTDSEETQASVADTEKSSENDENTNIVEETTEVQERETVVNTAKQIKTAVESTLGTEEAYDEVFNEGVAGNYVEVSAESVANLPDKFRELFSENVSYYEFPNEFPNVEEPNNGYTRYAFLIDENGYVYVYITNGSDYICVVPTEDEIAKETEAVEEVSTKGTLDDPYQFGEPVTIAYKTLNGRMFATDDVDYIGVTGGEIELTMEEFSNDKIKCKVNVKSADDADLRLSLTCEVASAERTSLIGGMGIVDEYYGTAEGSSDVISTFPGSETEGYFNLYEPLQGDLNPKYVNVTYTVYSSDITDYDSYVAGEEKSVWFEIPDGSYDPNYINTNSYGADSIEDAVTIFFRALAEKNKEYAKKISYNEYVYFELSGRYNFESYMMNEKNFSEDELYYGYLNIKSSEMTNLREKNDFVGYNYEMTTQAVSMDAISALESDASDETGKNITINDAQYVDLLLENPDTGDVFNINLIAMMVYDRWYVGWRGFGLHTEY
jgi:hypothetical protein